jgi:hypothetical protein
VALAAKEALALFERWDEARFARVFAHPEGHDVLKNGFAEARNTFGQCQLASGALEGRHGDGELGASIPVDCERGAVSNVDLQVNAAGKIEQIFLRPRPGAGEPPRCPRAPATPQR